jgi:uncharacterized protein (DUF983 family)
MIRHQAKARQMDESQNEFQQMDDDELEALWMGKDCPTCSRMAHGFGMLPTLCDECGTDRGFNSPLVIEIQVRGIDKKHIGQLP